MELHQPRQAYETRQSTGSPCSLKKRNANAHEKHGDRHGGPLRHLKLLPCAPCFMDIKNEWCGVTVMLRAGFDERWIYSPDRLFKELPPRSHFEI